jgi:hypothetical protein
VTAPPMPIDCPSANLDSSSSLWPPANAATFTADKDLRFGVGCGIVGNCPRITWGCHGFLLFGLDYRLKRGLEKGLKPKTQPGIKAVFSTATYQNCPHRVEINPPSASMSLIPIN